MTYPTFTSGDVLLASDMNAVGWWLVSDTTFTATNTVNVSSCFSSSYANYRLVFTVTAQSNPEIIYMRMRSGSTNNTAASYDACGIEYATGSATITALGAMAQTSWRISFNNSSPGYLSSIIDITNPQLTAYTGFINKTVWANSTTSIVQDETSGFWRGTTSFDGISLGIYGNAAYTMTGRLRIYGYRGT
jgi:hypothetical protein